MRNKRSNRVFKPRSRTKQVWSVNYLVEKISFRRGIRVVKIEEKCVVARGGAKLKRSMATLSVNPDVVSWTLNRI